MSAESIFSKPASRPQKSVLSRIARRQTAGDDSGIDSSEIPAFTDEQLSQFKRAPKVLVAADVRKDLNCVPGGVISRISSAVSTRR